MDIRNLKTEFGKVGFTVQRRGNQLAHQVASMASKRALPHSWTWNLPSALRQILENDRELHRSQRRGLPSLPNSEVNAPETFQHIHEDGSG